MTYAILFPGQGSQSVGMVPDVRAERAALFAAASDVLGWDVEEVIAEGPEEALTATERAQPALYVTSFALWEVFRSLLDDGPAAIAGHSLGEYTALAAAGAIGFLDGLALVAERGRAMADAAASNASGMAALLGADQATAEAVAAARRAEGGHLYVANINAPGQVVVAGGLDDLAWLEANARDLGVRRAVVLKVAGGFHSPYMAAARDRLSTALATASFRMPDTDVYANATAAVVTDPVADLAEQLTSPVRFAETLEAMAAAGVDTFVHVGPGDVTAGLARRTVPDARVEVVSSIAEARAVAEELSV
jgi:[acyl-carrier-protein] S-malonyltransferase